MIRIGTSGFSYKDWVGPFYPPDLPRREWLNFYAQTFSTCELNFSYYTIPKAVNLARMSEKVPDNFLFAIKAYRGITHERETPQAHIESFVGALDPLRQANKLGSVLLQFPYSFHANRDNRDYLRRVCGQFGDVPQVVEFRNRDWITEETFDMLRQLGVGYCCVDQPRFKNLVPPVAVATGPVAYVRFHGRNYKKWWQHDEAWERYDYRYEPEELAEWVPKIQSLQSAPLTLIYANNHWQGQAVDTARQLELMLEGV